MARLTDYEPHWINLPQAAPGVKFYVGVSFINPNGERGPCPACGHNRDKRIAFSFWPPIDPDNILPMMDPDSMATFSARFHTRVSGETFDTLTILPSIGLDPYWHGHLTAGALEPVQPRT